MKVEVVLASLIWLGSLGGPQQVSAGEHKDNVGLCWYESFKLLTGHS